MVHATSLCVYCASSTKVDQAYQDAAVELGTIMALQGVRLVYGGGRVGLMGLLADAIMAGGGEVVGIIPQHLDKAEISHQSIT